MTQMKTELVAMVSWGTQEPRFERSTLTKDETTKGRCLHYVAAHTAKGSRTNPKTGRYDTDATWHEPEAVMTRNYVFHPKKGGKLEKIRRMPEETVSALEAVDLQREELQRQILELNKKERELLAAAFDKSEPLRMNEIRGFKS